jgi:HD-GYP domain-containing protein (c-di-GMP phosphodiesterase class II)
LQADYEILKGIDFPWPINDTVLQHHERLDDSCYPQAVDACLRLFREQDYHFA